MIDISQAQLTRFAAAWVGAKHAGEGLSLPRQTLLPLNDVAGEWLLNALLKPFEKNEEYFYFHDDEDLSLHPVYQRAMEIFSQPEQLGEQARLLAERLYDCCEFPKIRGGEFFVAYFENILFMGDPVSAIGLWKVQTRQPFIQTARSAETFQVQMHEGVSDARTENIALILNTEESEGYRVAAIDTISKKDERSFWKDAFLGLRPIEDNYFLTRHYMTLSGEFIAHKYPSKFGADRAETATLLNQSGEYFKENERFEVEDFAARMFEQEEAREAFVAYRDQYAQAFALPLEDRFDISRQAVKKEGKIFKSVIKLDKNFHIYVHGRRDLIERGYDEEKGKKYYKVFFESEE